MTSTRGATVLLRIKRSTTIAIAALLVVFLPLTSSLSLKVAAETCEPPTDTGPGVRRPVGADAAMFTYNCGNGLWESAHYTYNPATGETTPNELPVYTYNAGTGNYDTTNWVFHAPSGSYVAYTESVPKPPAGARVVGGPPPPSPTGSSITNTGPNSNNTINNEGGVTSGSSIHNTGPSSNNSIDGSSTNSSTGNNTTNATVNNQLTATAQTGNALVLSNTTAGSARSGNAEDVANIMNMLQSSSNAVSGDMVTFVANIDGDVNGDLLLDPSALGTVQPASDGNVGNNDLTINSEVNATMNNTIDLTAESGDATVANNTKAGDAESGTARTIANVVNMIQSAVTSGKSFLGVININGNLNGDILLPPDFIDQLIAANTPTVDIIADTGPSSNNAITNNNGSSNTQVNNTNNQGITNNINLSAESGQANVHNNTSAGNAKSGSAKTVITAFNLTGSHVIGSNALLVFVNVSGEWVGLIVNAPAGATAAALGGGLSKNAQHDQSNNNTNIDSENNLAIHNDIKLASRSGDANVRDNTEAGNATSGDASSSLNLMNIQNSVISLSDWFGILFINVFGTWHGSFGINTSAGDPVAPSVAPGINGLAGAGNLVSFAPTNAAAAPARPAQSLAQAMFAATSVGGNPVSQSSITNTGPNSTNAVLAAASLPAPAPQQAQKQADSRGANWYLIIGSALFFITYMFGDKLYAMRQARSKP